MHSPKHVRRKSLFSFVVPAHASPTATAESPALRRRRLSVTLAFSSEDLPNRCHNHNHILNEPPATQAAEPTSETNVNLHDARSEEKKWRRALPWYHSQRLTMYKFEQLPPFLADNEFILSGYRALYTFEENWISLIKWHNESNNVWSHLISFGFFVTLIITIIAHDPSSALSNATNATNASGTIISIGLLPGNSSTSLHSEYPRLDDLQQAHMNHTMSAPGVSGSEDWMNTFPWLHPSASLMDKMVLVSFLLSGTLCFLFSSLFHLHMCHSETMMQAFGCLDYSGISVLIFGSSNAIAYFLFYEHPFWQVFWLSVLAICNLTGVFGPMFDVWMKPSFRWARTLIYVSSGVMGAGPVTHFFMWANFNNDCMPTPPALEFWFYGVAAVGGSYLVGAYIYASRMPERFYPGAFDYIGSSHQIWHLFVLCGAYNTFLFVLRTLNWRLANLGHLACAVID